MTNFWYFLRFVTTDDEERKLVRPYPVEWEYLRRFDDTINEHKRAVCNKSRRLMISNHCMLRQLWHGMRAGCGVEGVPGVFKGGVFSIGEVEAQELMQKIEHPYYRLPAWMKARAPLKLDNTMKKEWGGGGQVQAFPLKRTGPRTFGFSEVFFDEMAYQEAVRGVWRGMIPTLGDQGVLIAVSTPNGKQNLFYDVWTNKKGRYKRFFRINYSDWAINPEHDQKWRDTMAESMTKQEVAAELEGAFVHHTGEPVWDTFELKTHTFNPAEDKIEFNPKAPIYIGWDLGYHFPAALIAQRNSDDQFVVFREVIGADLEFETFCEREVLPVCEHLYGPRNINTMEFFFVPPDGFAVQRKKSKSGTVNDVGDIQLVFKIAGQPRVNTRPSVEGVGTRDNEGPRIKEVRKLWRLRTDGRPGIIISETGCPNLIEGCQGSYCYPETGNTEIPDKNEAAHIQDALQSIVTGFNRMSTIDKKQTKKRHPKRRKRPTLPWQPR